MKIAKVTYDAQMRALRWLFSNGQERFFFCAAVDEKNRVKACDHGFRQKLTDCYAPAETVSEAIERFDALAAALTAGDWNAGRSAVAGGVWVEAFARATNQSLEEAASSWRGLDEKTQKAVKRHSDVKMAKLAIDVERAEAAKKAAAAGGSDTDIDLAAIGKES